MTTHGGRRAGSGRKPLPGKSVTVCYVVTEALAASVRAWADRHGYRSVSEAARVLIERGLAQDHPTAPQP